MSLHKLAEVTITIEGLPEYTGTDDELQELSEKAEDLLESIDYNQLLIQNRTDAFPELVDKVVISIQREF